MIHVYKTCLKNQKKQSIIDMIDGSILLDNNLDREFVKTQMGHSQISMTENVYHRNRRDIEKKQNMISQIPDFAVSQVGT